MKSEEMKDIALYIYEAIQNKDNEQVLAELKNKVKELCERFPIYK